MSWYLESGKDCDVVLSTRIRLKRNFNDVFGYPNFIRFSWKTVSNIFKENNCSCLWENYDEDEEIED